MKGLKDFNTKQALTTVGLVVVALVVFTYAVMPMIEKKRAEKAVTA
jgi:hypothetical protein